MYLSALSLVIPFVLSLAGTGRAFLLVHEEEALQIALDNAGIVMGQKDRDLLNFLIFFNRTISALELSHHPAHACAKIPGPAQAACIVQDRVVEVAIRREQQAARVLASSAWADNRRAAWAEIGRFRAKVSLDRAIDVPIEARRCPICALEAGWKLSASPEDLVWHWTGGGGRLGVYVKMEGQSIQASSREWNYSLRVDDPRGQ